MTKKPTLKEVRNVLDKVKAPKQKDRIDSFETISHDTIENPKLEKVCSECGEKKSITLFNISDSGKRHRAYCKRCEALINNPKKPPKIVKQASPEHKPILGFEKLPTPLQKSVLVYNGVEQEEKKVSRNIFDTTTNFNEVIKPYIEKNEDGFTVKEIMPEFELPDKSKEYNQVYRILKELVKLNFLKVHKVRGKPNRYYLHDSEIKEEVPEKKVPTFLRNKEKAKQKEKPKKKSSNILESLQKTPEKYLRNIERCSPGEPIDPLESLKKERDRLQDYLNDAIKVSNKFEKDAVTALKEIKELREQLKEGGMTDQGEYGKMTPRPAIPYWKGLAEKYRENARNFGTALSEEREALSEERDKNSALRGKILKIMKEHEGKGLGGKLALLLPKILSNIESIGIEPSKEYANTPEFLKVLISCKSTKDMLELITFLDKDQQKSLENINKNVIRFEIKEE